MTPARIIRAAERFRKRYGFVGAPCESLVEYMDFHDAIHCFIGAGPNYDDPNGEPLAFHFESVLLKRECPRDRRIAALARKYRGLFADLALVA